MFSYYKYDKPRQCVKNQRYHFANKCRDSQGYDLSSSHVKMWDWTIRKAERQRIDAFELWCWTRLLRVPLTARRSNQSILKEINPEYRKDWRWSWSSKTLATWYEQLIIGKDPDPGKDWRQEEKRVTEGEMVGWHHWFNGHELGQTPGSGDGQGGLACYSPWGHEELDMSWRLNNNKHPCAYTCASIHACMFIFIFWSRPRYRISQSMGMAVSEFLLLRDKILRRVTNSPALLYCTGRCHMFALQGSELLLPFVKARGRYWGGGLLKGRAWPWI